MTIATNHRWLAEVPSLKDWIHRSGPTRRWIISSQDGTRHKTISGAGDTSPADLKAFAETLLGPGAYVVDP